MKKNNQFGKTMGVVIGMRAQPGFTQP